MRVAIDPGHPSSAGDTGAVSLCGRLIEADYTIGIARELHRALQHDEIPCLLLRERNDEVVSVLERAQRAKAAEADLVVSIHVDAWHEPTRHGATIFHWPGNDDGRRVADQIASSWPAVLRRSWRATSAEERLWPRTHAVLGAYQQTAVLAECGMASTPRDVHALLEPTVQAQIVGALMQGIRRFRQLREASWL